MLARWREQDRARRAQETADHVLCIHVLIPTLKCLTSTSLNTHLCSTTQGHCQGCCWLLFTVVC